MASVYRSNKPLRDLLITSGSLGRRVSGGSPSPSNILVQTLDMPPPTASLETKVLSLQSL